MIEAGAETGTILDKTKDELDKIKEYFKNNLEELNPFKEGQDCGGSLLKIMRIFNPNDDNIKQIIKKHKVQLLAIILESIKTYIIDLKPIYFFSQKVIPIFVIFTICIYLALIIIEKGKLYNPEMFNPENIDPETQKYKITDSNGNEISKSAAQSYRKLLAVFTFFITLLFGICCVIFFLARERIHLKEYSDSIVYFLISPLILYLIILVYTSIVNQFFEYISYTNYMNEEDGQIDKPTPIKFLVTYSCILIFFIMFLFILFQLNYLEFFNKYSFFLKLAIFSIFLFSIIFYSILSSQFLIRYVNFKLLKKKFIFLIFICIVTLLSIFKIFSDFLGLKLFTPLILKLILHYMCKKTDIEESCSR